MVVAIKWWMWHICGARNARMCRYMRMHAKCSVFGYRSTSPFELELFDECTSARMQLR